MAELVFPIWSVAFLFLVHILFQRGGLWPAKLRSPQIRLAWLVLCTPLCFTLAIGIWAHSLLLCLYTFLCSFAFCYSYFHFFNMALTARRIHLLILQLQKKSFDQEEYNIEIMIERRLQRLKESGLIEEKEGRLYARKGTMLLAALALKKMRSFFYASRV